MSYLVAFILAINPYLSDHDAALYAMQLEKHCSDPYLGATIIQVESSFRPHAFHYNTNDTIDIGLFQINSVHNYSPHVLLDASSNIRIGCSMVNSGKYSHSSNPRLKALYNARLMKVYLKGVL